MHKKFSPSDLDMWAWFQHERQNPALLPTAFRDVGKIVILNTHRVEQAKKHAEFCRKHGIKSRSHAQFARNLMISLALTETVGNARQAAKLLGVESSTISRARPGMWLGEQFHRDPNARFEDFDVAAMSPMPEYRFSGGPENLFARYTKFWPEMIQRCRHLYDYGLSDTALFLLIDLTHRSKADDSVNWAFHIYSEPTSWVERTGLKKVTFYRALKQLRNAGLIFQHRHKHWTIAYKGPHFKWLAEHGFIDRSFISGVRAPCMSEKTAKQLTEVMPRFFAARDYAPLRLQVRVKDYFTVVFQSIRSAFRKIRSVALRVFRTVPKLLAVTQPESKTDPHYGSV
jgi:hypothetical protein